MSSEVMSYEVGLDRLRQLQKFYEVEGAELGEFCALLDRLWSYTYCAQTKGFEDLIAEEILAQLEFFQNNAVVIEEEQTYTRTFKYIEWQ